MLMLGDRAMGRCVCMYGGKVGVAEKEKYSYGSKGLWVFLMPRGKYPQLPCLNMYVVC